MKGEIVRVTVNSVRGYWLTETGQRAVQYVPAGLYRRGPAGEGPGGVPTVALVAPGGWAYHVAADVAARLPAA